MIQDILDKDNLLRRVKYTNPEHIKPDGSASSFAFKLRRGETGLSVDIERLTSYEASIRDHRNYRLFSLLVSYVRSLGLECLHDPLPDNYAHALIKGKINNRLSQQLAISARRIPYPD